MYFSMKTESPVLERQTDNHKARFIPLKETSLTSWVVPAVPWSGELIRQERRDSRTRKDLSVRAELPWKDSACDSPALNNYPQSLHWSHGTGTMTPSMWEVLAMKCCLRAFLPSTQALSHVYQKPRAGREMPGSHCPNSQGGQQLGPACWA